MGAWKYVEMAKCAYDTIKTKSKSYYGGTIERNVSTQRRYYRSQ